VKIYSRRKIRKNGEIGETYSQKISGALALKIPHCKNSYQKFQKFQKLQKISKIANDRNADNDSNADNATNADIASNADGRNRFSRLTFNSC